jgi:hypothetical protein
MSAATKPVGSVQPDLRGRVRLTKYLPGTPPLYLVYADPATGIIELRPAAPMGEAEAA